MSALEIAQNYRQQQALQERTYQNVLPTPPDSTSPLWSSAFSPYQESLLSPEVLAAVHLPSILTSRNPLLGQSQNILLHQAELKHQARLANYERVNGARLNVLSHEQELPHRVQDSTQYQDFLGSGSSMSPSLDLVSQVAHAQLRGQSINNHASIMQNSPVPPPRAPPNTPSNMGVREGKPVIKQPHVSASAPLSPTSPKHRQNISQQHARSIPLSRLIQRRLSAVPEEDSIQLADTSSLPVVPPMAEGRELPAPRKSTVIGKSCGTYRRVSLC